MGRISSPVALSPSCALDGHYRVLLKSLNMPFFLVVWSAPFGLSLVGPLKLTRFFVPLLCSPQFFCSPSPLRLVFPPPYIFSVVSITPALNRQVIIPDPLPKKISLILLIISQFPITLISSNIYTSPFSPLLLLAYFLSRLYYLIMYD